MLERRMLTGSSRPPVGSGGLRVLEVDQDHIKGTAWNMLFMIWHKRTTGLAMDRARELLLEVSRAHPGGIGVLQVVEVGAVPPDSAARQAIHRFLAAGEGHVRHSSVIHEGAGFGAAGVRAVMAGIYMLGRPKFPHVVFASVAGAARWHAEHQAELELHTEAAHIEGVVRALEQTPHGVGPPG
jgi:hypothetical protein